MSNLCFIQSPDFLGSPTGALLGEDSIFVPMSWRAGQVLRRKGRRIAWPEETLKNNAESIHQHAWDFSNAWYCDGKGYDPTVVDGISLGHALNVHAWNTLIGPILKNFVISLRLVKDIKPEKVVFDDGVPSSLKLSLKVLSLTFPFSFVDLEIPETKPDLYEGLGDASAWAIPSPRFWRDVILKTTYNFIACAIRRVSNPSGKRSILIAYYPSLHALFLNLVPPANKNQAQWELSEWPPRNLALKFLAAGIPMANTSSPPLRRHGVKSSQILDQWRSLVSKPGFSDRFVFEGISVWPVLQNGLDALLSSFLPLLLVRLEKSHRLFRRSRYQGLVIPFDSAPESRVLVGQAHRYGVRTVLATHGIGFIHGWDKGEGMQSHVVAPPGPAVGAQYVAAGIPPTRVWPVGPGLMDEYAPRPESPPNEMRRRVLLLTNPAMPFSAYSGPGFEEIYLTTVLAVLSKFPGLTISVKLHPSESIDFYQQLLNESSIEGVSILGRGPFLRVIENYGTVIGTMSTALIQAMVRRRWVISANVMNFPFPEPYNEASGFPMVRSPEALESWLSKVFGPTPPATEYEPLLSRYAGILDGRESERFLIRLDNYCREKEIEN